MAYTVRKLITNAWYLAGIVARTRETVSGDEITDGLELLNDLLGVKTANSRLIPYYKFSTINCVAGQERYFIENLIDVATLTFNIGPVRYFMQRVSRTDYDGSPRVDNISSLPFSYNVERELDGAAIRLYFKPQAAFPLNIVGKYGLSSVDSLDLDLETLYDRFYIVYLRYALAEYICEEYNITIQEGARMKLRELEEIIMDIAPYDFTMQKMSSFGANGGINWGDVNIGRGWRP